MDSYRLLPPDFLGQLSATLESYSWRGEIIHTGSLTLESCPALLTWGSDPAVPHTLTLIAGGLPTKSHSYTGGRYEPWEARRRGVKQSTGQRLNPESMNFILRELEEAMGSFPVGAPRSLQLDDVRWTDMSYTSSSTMRVYGFLGRLPLYVHVGSSRSYSLHILHEGVFSLYGVSSEDLKANFQTLLAATGGPAFFKSMLTPDPLVAELHWADFSEFFEANQEDIGRLPKTFDYNGSSLCRVGGMTWDEVVEQAQAVLPMGKQQ